MARAAICSGLRFRTPGFSANLPPSVAPSTAGRGGGRGWWKGLAAGEAPLQLDLQSWPGSQETTAVGKDSW